MSTKINLEGTGASISFGTSGFSAPLVSLTLPELTREKLDTSHLGTIGGKTNQPGKLYAVGDISCVFRHDAEETSLILEEPETITITYPLLPGESTAKKLSFTGYAISDGGEEVAIDTIMDTSVTLAVSGAVTVTPAIPAGS
jgi:Ca2+-binding RTX toxin-like protein